MKFTKPQLEMIVYELEQSLRGDDDSYDKKLKTIINKFKEELENV